MNKKLFLLLAGLIALFPGKLFSETFYYDDFVYEVIDAGLSTCRLQYPDGGAMPEDVILPSHPKDENNVEYTLVSIKGRAFKDCKNLQSIEIPNTVISLEDGFTFWNCVNLKSVKISNSLTKLPGGVFMGCTNLTSIELPSGLTSIEGSTFSGCASLESLTLPNTVSSIGNGAFRGCASLKSLTLPNTVSSIGENAFYGCSSLESVNIPDGVTEIKSGAFSGCKSLKSIELPESVNSICGGRLGYMEENNPLEKVDDIEGAFWYCSSLETINIPKNITLIEPYTFFRCGLKSAEFSNSVTEIGKMAFYQCGNLESVNIPNSVTKIGKMAFFECSSLESVNIPNGVTEIKSRTFCSCNSLSSITIPESVTSIEDAAFGVTGLISIEIPASVKSMGFAVFGNCKDLTEVSFRGAQTPAGNNTFSGCDKLNSVKLPESLQSIDEGLFAECKNLKSITIPESVSSIGPFAFWGSGLTSIEIPELVTTIKREAFHWCTNLESVIMHTSAITILGEIIDGSSYGAVFAGCSNLKSITLPESLESIGPETFKECSSLESIEIPNSVTSIGYAAFDGCSNLTSVTIPESVTQIGLAFRGCDNLKEIYYYTDEPVKASKDTFDNTTYNSAMLYVLGSGYKSISSIEPWSSFTNSAHILIHDGILYEIIDDEEKICEIRKGQNLAGDLVLPNNPMYKDLQYTLVKIGEDTFANCKNLTSVVIPTSVTSIGDKAFTGCKNLTSVTIPNSVTSIGSMAFEKCSNLSTVEIPNSITSLYGVFSDCTGLTSINIPNSVTSIDYAFSKCKNLTSVEVPNSVTSMNYAFNECTGLKTVNIPTSITSIEGTFSECSSLTSIEIPNEVTSIGVDTFNGCIALKSVDIPASVTSIGDQAFLNCRSLTTLEIPNSVISIGEQAFQECVNLTYIKLPTSITSLGFGTFNGCMSLPTIKIPDSVTEIGEYVFVACFGLKSVILPNSMTKMGEGEVFTGCPLEDIYYYTTNPVAGNVTIFDEKCYDTCKLHVIPNGTENFSNTLPWSEFKNIQAIRFGDCDGNDIITITDAVNIANYAVGNEVIPHFCLEAADVNEDGDISLADASKTAVLVLDEAKNGSYMKIMDLQDNDEVDTLIVSDYFGNIGESVAVDVKLDNRIDYVALQADILIPDGLTLESITSGGRAADHSLMSKQVDERIYRIVLFDLGNSIFAATDESMFHLNIKVDDPNAGDIIVDHILASDMKGKEYMLCAEGGHNNSSLGVGGVEIGKSEVKVEGDAILICGAVGEEVTICTVDGKIVGHFVANSDSERYTVGSGIYVVIVGRHREKVIVK